MSKKRRVRIAGRHVFLLLVGLVFALAWVFSSAADPEPADATGSWCRLMPEPDRSGCLRAYRSSVCRNAGGRYIFGRCIYPTTTTTTTTTTAAPTTTRGRRIGNCDPGDYQWLCIMIERCTARGGQLVGLSCVVPTTTTTPPTTTTRPPPTTTRRPPPTTQPPTTTRRPPPTTQPPPPPPTTQPPPPPTTQPPPPPPQRVPRVVPVPTVACATDDTVSVSWSAYSGATSYKVELKGTFNETRYTNPPSGRTYRYTVSASQARKVTHSGRGDFKYSARLGATTRGATRYSAWSTSASCDVDPSLAWVTRGAYNGIMTAVDEAFRPCRDLTKNRLAAIMIAISVHEVNGRRRDIAASPMSLSRNETTHKYHDPRFFSHGTKPEYVNAYWSPGVGLWQLDNLKNGYVDAIRLNHAERADTAVGGIEVATELRRLYCKGDLFRPPPTPRAWRWIGNIWFACETNNACWATHRIIYNVLQDSLNVHIVEGWNNKAGGVQPRKCRWDQGMEIDCFLYDTENPEGNMGRGGRPLAHPFISFTDNKTNETLHTRYAVWPKVWPTSTISMKWPDLVVQPGVAGGVTKTIFKAVPKNVPVRDADNPTPGTVSSLGPVGWFDNTVNGKTLYIKSCRPDSHMRASVCQWVNLNTGATQPAVS